MKAERRRAVESCDVLDVGALARRGALREGAAGTLGWPDGGATVDFRVGQGRLHLGDQAIEIGTVACGCFGARRAWICPGCKRRARVLYRPPGEGQVLCRACHRLVYASQREGPADRAMRKAEKIRDRLGGEPGAFSPFPTKPKWMHWRTYARQRRVALTGC